MNKAAPPQDTVLHASALLIAIAVTLFTGWLLSSVPEPRAVAPQMDVVLIEAIVPVPQAPSRETEVVADSSERSPRARQPTSVPDKAREVETQVTLVPQRPRSDAPQKNQPATSNRLYTSDGRVALATDPSLDPMRAPPGRAPGDQSDPKWLASKDKFERRNPLEAQPPTGFEEYWESDGTLGNALIGKATKRLKKVVDALPWQKDIQSARARPPPPVRFNPALHERPSDLGSEATGDAYKAAPIAFEPAPNLLGEASRRIRTAIGEVETDFAACDRKRMRELLEPAITRVAELERIERAMASGVDPIRAEQLLPRSADMAYDQARRAIWYARQKLASCAK